MKALRERIGTRWRRLIVAATVALALYAVAGFFILPPIVKSILIEKSGALLHRQVEIKRLRINPFALSSSIEGLTILEPDGPPLLRWDSLYVNFEIISFVRHPWRFREINLSNVSGRLVMRADGTLNVSDIIDSLSAPPAVAAPTPPGPPPVVEIGRLRLEGAEYIYRDESHAEPFETTLGPLHLDLRNFATEGDARNRYAFSGTTEAGEAFSWNGTFSIEPLRSAGDVTLDHLTLGKYRPFYRGMIPFDVRSGTADVRSSYEFEWTPASHVVRVKGAALSIHDLTLSEHGLEEIAASAPQAELTGGDIDIMTGAAKVATLSITGGKVLMKRYPDGSINLLKMLLPFFVETEGMKSPSAPKPAPPPATAPSPAAAAAPPTPETIISAGEIAFHDYTVDIEDQMPRRPAKVTLDKVELIGRGVDNVPATTSKAVLDARWAGEGTIHADGDLSLVTLVADLAVKIDGMSLQPLDPYIDPLADARLKSGAFSAEGRVTVNLVDLDHPKFTFKGGARVTDLASVDGTFGDDLVRFKSFGLQQIDYTLQTSILRIRELSLVDPIASLIVEPDGRTNIEAALRLTPPPPDDQPAVAPAGEAAPAPAAGDAVAAPTEAKAPAAAAPAAPSAGLITIGTARIKNGQIRLADRSMQPVVAFGLTKINGTLKGLSSRELARADVDLEAKVDDIAPVTVTGTINPLSDNEFSDLTLKTSGIDLTPLSPYASKYLGYALQKGKLELDMKYMLDQRRLQGANLINADQFTLGEKSDSPDATHLPVRLGLAILKDRNGLITLDVPVEGSLDDPKFRLGRVILHALGNVFTKIVTSPFKMLAHAFGGKDDADLSSLEFEAGTAVLAAGEQEKIATLAKALHERPALSLEMQGSVEEASDHEALKKLKLESLLKQARWETLGRKEKDETPVESVEVSPGERDKAVKAAYKKIRAAHPEDQSPKLEQPAEMEPWILQQVEVPPEDLRNLAAARARAVHDGLVATGQVEPERLFMKEGGEAGAAPGRRVTLEMK